MSRRHNDANVVTLAGRSIGTDDAVAIVDAFLATGFEGDRHQRRVDQISAIEAANPCTPPSV
jgi:ribose 5-phosphate isomerase B